MSLYHYTCRDHGVRGLGRGVAVIAPRVQPSLGGVKIAWFTDMDNVGDGQAIGFSHPSPSPLLSCDRRAARYEVRADCERLVVPWLSVRGRFSLTPDFELDGVAKPERWFVADESVVAEYDRAYAPMLVPA